MPTIADEEQRMGLCFTCRYLRLIRSDRGSVFCMCQRSATDPTFPKYPRLPVRQCRGYQRRHGVEEPAKSQ